MVGWKSTLASSRSLNWHTHEEKSLHGKSHLLPDRASTVTTSIPVYLPLTHSTRSVSLFELTTVSRTQDCSLARSEERRSRNECVSTCSSRESLFTEKNNKKN